MNFFNKDDVSINEQSIIEIPTDQVLLAFNTDEQGEAFCDWWEDVGINAFKKWTEGER